MALGTILLLAAVAGIGSSIFGASNVKHERRNWLLLKQEGYNVKN